MNTVWSTARRLTGRLLVGVAGAALVWTGTGAVPLPNATAQDNPDSSQVTVSWAGKNATELQKYQPDRSSMVDNADGSGHWNDFKNLTITVSQTSGLIDQVVKVTATGMNSTVREPMGARNFLQVFQCWGKDPNAADFASTCQYGAYSSNEVGGSIPKAMTQVFSNNANYLVGRGGVPFTAVTGQQNKPVTITLPGESGATYTNNGLGAFFNSASSNERVFVPVGSDGNAMTSLTVQSDAAQKYLGCGNPQAAGERCWLVVVPRGEHSGSMQGQARCGFTAFADNNFGDTPSTQMGSPLDPKCSLWNNRVVIPLDFENPKVACASGAEQRVVGTEFVAEAFSSWQTQLCSGEGGSTFNLTTNSGNLARGQLLTGQVNMVAVADPVTTSNIGGTNPDLVADAQLRYAPLTNTAVTIAMVIEGKDGTVYPDIKLTPRLIAKLLTQSYRYDIPIVEGRPEWTVGQSLASRPTFDTIASDPEWLGLGNPSTAQFTNTDYASWVVFGKRDEAAQLLWRYVQSDADAVAFLRGDPDPWGMTVNPYYLPSTNPSAAGGGFPVDLSTTPIDYFPKEDQSVAPSTEKAAQDYRGQQVDSTAYSPYSENLSANASRISNVDRRYTQYWDPNKVTANGAGYWSDGDGPIQPGNPRFILGPTTSAATENYALSSAQLALPLATRTTKNSVDSARQFSAYNATSTQLAVNAFVDAGNGIFTPAKFTDLPRGAYPLTVPILAVVNLNSAKLTEKDKKAFAHLLTHVVGSGNIASGQRGGLPEGYIPLTEAQKKSTTALVNCGLTTTTCPPATDDPSPTAKPTTTSPTGSNPGTESPADSPASTLAPAPVAAPSAAPGTAQPVVGSSAKTEQANTDAATAPLQGVLAGSLIAGLAGLPVGVFLLKRRPDA